MAKKMKLDQILDAALGRRVMLDWTGRPDIRQYDTSGFARRAA